MINFRHVLEKHSNDLINLIPAPRLQFFAFFLFFVFCCMSQTPIFSQFFSLRLWTWAARNLDVLSAEIGKLWIGEFGGKDNFWVC